jgi:hypothetical protein
MSTEDVIPTIEQYTALKDPKDRWALIKGLGYWGYGAMHFSPITGLDMPYDADRDPGAVHNGKLRNLYAKILKVETEHDILHAVEQRLSEKEEKYQLLRMSQGSPLEKDNPATHVLKKL